MKIADGFILESVGDEYVGISLDYQKNRFSGMIKLSGVGAFLWKLLECDKDEDELVEAVVEHYNIEKDIAIRDIRMYVEALKKRGIVTTQREVQIKNEKSSLKESVEENFRKAEEDKLIKESEEKNTKATIRKIPKKYQIADIPFCMKSFYSFTPNMCKKYEIDAEQDVFFELEVTKKEIRAEFQDETEEFGEDYLESLALYRKLCEKMLEYDTFLMHCSAIAVDGKAYLFTAPSGTGKSTHTRLWRAYFGEKACMVNDDKPLIQITDKDIYVCGTPWSGKHYLDTNIKVPIQGICVLSQGKENRIERIRPVDAYAELYRQAYRPRVSQGVLKTLSFLKRIAETIPMYRMSCTISEEAVEVAYNAMK